MQAQVWSTAADKPSTLPSSHASGFQVPECQLTAPPYCVVTAAPAAECLLCRPDADRIDAHHGDNAHFNPPNSGVVRSGWSNTHGSSRLRRMVSGCSAARGRVSRLHDDRSTSDSTPAMERGAMCCTEFTKLSCRIVDRSAQAAATTHDIFMLHASNTCYVPVFM